MGLNGELIYAVPYLCVLKEKNTWNQKQKKQKNLGW